MNLIDHKILKVNNHGPNLLISVFKTALTYIFDKGRTY